MTSRQKNRGIKKLVKRYQEEFRLNRMGLPEAATPGFARNLHHLVRDRPCLGLDQINQTLKWLGWHDIKLDEITLQLMTAHDAPYFRRPRQGRCRARRRQIKGDEK